MSWSSNFAPASPVLPSAVVHATLISKSVETMPSASAGAAFAALLPIAPKAAAAAQAGLRSEADSFSWTPATAIMEDAVSSSVSLSNCWRLSISGSALTPMAPSAAAAATRAPTSLLPRSLPISATCGAALSPKPPISLIALMRTKTSLSPRSLVAVTKYFSALSFGIAHRAAALTRGWLLSSMPPRASISASMEPRPMQAPITTSTSDSFSLAATFPEAESAFMLPRAMQASTTMSRSESSRHFSTDSAYAEAASPK
mmetsp:Transcript_90074/g.280373  ORF Transcript_90074/g.280373 Transcript_90074/m.280373 type:complete len:258 (+) Transcript_90074:655-1428(+)